MRIKQGTQCADRKARPYVAGLAKSVGEEWDLHQFDYYPTIPRERMQLLFLVVCFPLGRVNQVEFKTPNMVDYELWDECGQGWRMGYQFVPAAIAAFPDGVNSVTLRLTPDLGDEVVRTFYFNIGPNINCPFAMDLNETSRPGSTTSVVPDDDLGTLFWVVTAVGIIVLGIVVGVLLYFFRTKETAPIQIKP